MAKTTINKYLPATLRPLLALSAYGFIVYKLAGYYSHWQARELEETFDFSGGWFFVVVISMAVNWLLEAMRWQKLTAGIQHLSLYQSIKAVLTGITIGLLTPKRIGDVGGRCMMMPPGNRQQGLLAFGVGSLLQSGVTLVYGALALLLLLAGEAHLQGPQGIILLLAALVPGSLLLLAVNNLPFVEKLLLKIPWLKKQAPALAYLSNQKRNHLFRIFLLGMARYLVFSTQFYLLLRMFGTHVSFSQAFIAIGLMYFLMAFIPVSSLAELGIRGSIAAFAFGLFTPHTEGAILAASGLWIINLALPALTGAWIIGTSNYKFNVAPIRLKPGRAKRYRPLEIP